MSHDITVMPQQQRIEAAAGENLLQVLRRAGISVQAPCGGNGSCGKCKVLVDGQEALACHTIIDRDMTVTLPPSKTAEILTDGIGVYAAAPLHKNGFFLAFDIGTTSVAGYLLDGTTGQELACESTLNPQASFGADVISRIRHALSGHMEELTWQIRKCLSEMAAALCARAGILPGRVSTISIVGNPAMQQLFLGIRPNNLATLPFAPVLTQAEMVAAGNYVSGFEHAQLLIVPNIAGFVGADTVACMLATMFDTLEKPALLVDIGTNGEMVLGHKNRRVACSTAAGPALEGANIQFGMRAAQGAIDRVRWDGSAFVCHIIGDTEATGICGSGLIDAVAAAMDAGLLNSRGRILNDEHVLHLTNRVYLTQEDIRQVQTAKGAIAAGIQLMAAHLGWNLEDIELVYLAGAFGTFMDPRSACRIGLLPPELEERITAIGNAAGSGAKLLATDPAALVRAQQLTDTTEHLNLALHPDFPKTFAKHMML